VIRNKAITDVFEPGSTFKIFVAGSLLDRGLVNDSDRFECKGYVEVGGITIYDTGVHGSLDFRRVLEKSCNVGMVESVRRIERDELYENLKSFGFGTPTGIQLPGEAAGTLRKPADWSGISKYAIAIGQEVAVTPLQLISSAAAIANKGVLMQPRIIRKIEGADGSLLKEYTPLKVRKVMDREVATGLLNMLGGVFSDSGTGYKAQIEGYQIAGKTGTAQIADNERGGYLDDQFYASFVGFLPLPDPRLVILVTLDRPVGETYGGQTAAPVFKNIVERIAPYLNILPSFSEVYVLKDDS
jgi:cell division protein FtsI/penicillin-binding protein 2